VLCSGTRVDTTNITNPIKSAMQYIQHIASQHIYKYHMRDVNSDTKY
jgi:hypothetical protein